MNPEPPPEPPGPPILSVPGTDHGGAPFTPPPPAPYPPPEPSTGVPPEIANVESPPTEPLTHADVGPPVLGAPAPAAPTVTG